MKESGYYPPGAEFDSNAPYNQRDPEEVSVDVCVSQTLHKNTTIKTDDYIAESWEEYDEEGHRGGIYYNFNESNLLKAWKDDDYTIPDLLNILKSYITKELEKENSRFREFTLNRILKACEGWEVDEEEVIQE